MVFIVMVFVVDLVVTYMLLQVRIILQEMCPKIERLVGKQKIRGTK